MRTALAVAVCVLAQPAWSAEPARVLVKDVAPVGVEAGAAAAMSGAVCDAVARTRGVSALCGEDLRAMLELAALTAALDGCAEGDACFGPVSKAMSARYMVSGRLARLESLFVLSLSLVDGEGGAVVGRTEIESTSVDRLQADVGEAVSGLFARLRR